VLTKTNAVRSLVAAGDYRKALGIVKGFRLGLSAEALNKLKLAYECMVHPAFYEQLGTDTAEAIAEGIQVLKELYGVEREDN